MHPKDTFLIDIQYVLASFHSYHFLITLDYRISLSFLWSFPTVCIDNVVLHGNALFVLRFLLLQRDFIQHGLGKRTLLMMIIVFFISFFLGCCFESFSCYIFFLVLIALLSQILGFVSFCCKINYNRQVNSNLCFLVLKT